MVEKDLLLWPRNSMPIRQQYKSVQTDHNIILAHVWISDVAL